MDEGALWIVRICVVLVLVAAVILVPWSTRRAADGRMPRNEFGGIRIPSTMASENAWRAGHVAARGAADVAAWGLGPACVLVLVLPGVMGFVLAALSGALWLLAWVLVGAVRASKAARAVSGTGDNPEHPDSGDE